MKSSSKRVNEGRYDGAGNQTVVNGDTLTYDAENRMVSAYDPVMHSTETYVYDGSGQRVEKSVAGGTSTIYVYDAFGKLAAEYGAVQGNPPCTTCYLSYDWLGSVRMVTDASGNVMARHDFLPFGEEIPANTAGRGPQWGSTTDVEQKFTGQIRDQETGMDYFHARYFTAPLGRFNSPDPENAGANALDPRAWNAYAYVTGNPLNSTDPSGETKCRDGRDPGNGAFCVTKTAKDETEQISPLEGRILDVLIRIVRVNLQINQGLSAVGNWVAAPRNSGCMAASMLGGASVGGMWGMAGLSGGPAVLLTEPAGMAGGAALGGLGGMVSCMSGSGGSGGVESGGSPEGAGGLSPGARKKLGNLTNRAGEKVRDVIRSRGGTASNVNQAGPWADKTLGETGQAAANGDPTAETAIKIAKQAGRLGQQY